MTTTETEPTHWVRFEFAIDIDPDRLEEWIVANAPDGKHSTVRVEDDAGEVVFSGHLDEVIEKSQDPTDS